MFEAFSEDDQFTYVGGIKFVKGHKTHFGDYGHNPAEKNVSQTGYFQSRTSTRTMRRKRERMLKKARKRGEI